MKNELHSILLEINKDDIETKKETTYSPSDTYMERIRQLQTQRTYSHTHSVKSLLIKVACILVCVMAGFGAVKTVRASYNEDGIHCFVTQRQEYVTLTITRNDQYQGPSKVDHFYEPILPDGFEEILRMQSDTVCKAVYRNRDGLQISFYQAILQDDHFQTVGPNHIERINIGDHIGFQTRDNGCYLITWDQRGYLLRVIASEEIGYDELMNIVNTLRKEVDKYEK